MSSNRGLNEYRREANLQIFLDEFIVVHHVDSFGQIGHSGGESFAFPFVALGEASKNF